MVDYALSFPKGVLVLIRHGNTAKEWGALVSSGLTPSIISYEPHINSRMVQGLKPRVGGWMTVGKAWDNAATGYQVNRSPRSGELGGAASVYETQGEAPEETWADVETHGLWEQGKAALFDVRTTYLDAGS